MMSPLLGVAAVNSLLFGSFAVSKRIVSPYPELTTAQTALAGGMAGGVTAVLASPVELFKIKSVPSPWPCEI
jgi:solute carrier family 25 carnitine/acylcarnitine transporter 20/29